MGEIFKPPQHVADPLTLKGTSIPHVQTLLPALPPAEHLETLGISREETLLICLHRIFPELGSEREVNEVILFGKCNKDLSVEEGTVEEMRATNGVFSSQSLLWVPRAFPVYKFGNRSSSKARSKGAWVSIEQFLPGFGGGLLLGVLFPCYFWPSLVGQMLLHCFTESCKVRRSRVRQLEVSQQALKYGSWRRRTEYRERLLPNTLYLTLRLPSTFGRKWALGLLLILSITNLKLPQMVIVLSC